MLSAAVLHADAWSTFRGDSARSGVSTESLVAPLELQWTCVPVHPPRPAWPEPGKEMHRMSFDYSFEVVVGGGLVFFGSSADHAVRAIDLATGTERWSVFTEGPVRFAPAVAGNRVFVASDDGCVYCLSAKEGNLLWRFRAGHGDERLLGNGQMISRWALRSGVVVADGVVYITAGMWSPDGVYVYALRAEDGTVLWMNDTCGQFYMAMPHSSMEGIGGVSPQGHALLMGNTLVVPNGRCSPAGFDTKTGKLLYLRNDWTKLHHAGDSWVVGANGLVWSTRRPAQSDRHVELKESGPAPGEGLMAWDARTGEERLAMVGKYRAVVRGDVMYASGREGVAAIDMKTFVKAAPEFIATGKIDPAIPKEDQHGTQTKRGEGSLYPWHTSKVTPMDAKRFEKWNAPIGWTYALILAGDKLIAGGRGKVTVLSADTGKVLWRADVEGSVRSLAVAGGRLVVSASTGRILCFGADRRDRPGVVRATTRPSATSVEARQKAKAILEATGITSGYCFMPGSGNGDLAVELARQSELVIYVLEPDVDKVGTVRQVLEAEGLQGVRVVVHHGALDRLPYTDYFANLVVCDESFGGQLGSLCAKGLYRIVRPCGGVAHVATGKGATWARQWLGAAGVPAEEIRVQGDVVKVTRGGLPGAADWTHEYGDASRPAASKDQHVRLPMRMLWFGGPGPARMVSRHWRSPAPLYVNGRMFVAGEHHVIGMDAYNGRELWCRELPDVGRYSAKYRGGNIVADGKHVYALQGTTCLRLDAATGKTVQTYTAPPEAVNIPVLKNPIDKIRNFQVRGQPLPNKIEWEFLAVTDDLVIGTVGLPNVAKTWWPEAYPEGKYLIALRKDSGEPAWIYTARESVSPNAVAIRGDRLYVIDRTSMAQLRRDERRGEKATDRPVLKALELATGKPIWETGEKLSCRMLWMGDDVLLVTGWGQPSAYAAEDGKLLWRKRMPGHPYPVIVGDTFYLYPCAYDLRTGEVKQRVHPLTAEAGPWLFGAKGGCGSISGCPGALFFRSGAAGFCDLANDSGIHWLGQVRSSCWINMIAAGGMLLIPEGASNCTCPYNLHTSLAMVPTTSYENWSIFPKQGTARGARVRRAPINFGAVGEQRDPEGALWVAFPRPFRPGALMLPLTTTNTPEYYRRNAVDLPIRGTNRPWIYTSGCRGLRGARLDLRLDRPAAALPCAQPPQIDGKLDDACWDGRSPLVLVTEDQAIDGHAVAYLRTDANNIYVAFKRKASLRDGKPVPWTMNTKGKDVPVWRDDSFNVRFADDPARTGIYLDFSASGATFDAIAKRKIQMLGAKPQWNGEWASAVHVTAEMWSVEVAVPWGMLTKEGLQKARLFTYMENRNHTGVGVEKLQYKYRTWRRLNVFNWFTPVAYRQLKVSQPRRLRVMLHFAELEDVKPGERVFDVKVQDKIVLRGLDVMKEAGGRDTALVKEVRGVEARDTATLELIPRSDLPPILSGVEFLEESAAMASR